VNGIFFKKRVEHLFEWIRVLIYIVNNRGRNTYGAEGVKNLIKKYLMDYGASPQELKNAEESLMQIEELLRITRVKNLRRFGASNDGGYIGLEAKEAPIVLSGGGGKNIDFEIELAESGSKVHLYDPTIKCLPKEHVNISHVHKALSVPGNDKFKSYVTLAEALSNLNPNSDDPIWLKIDIEGSEIELLSDDVELIPKFQQIFVEFHDTYQVTDSDFRDRFLRILSKLEESFYLISMVSNNWKGITNYGCSFLPDTFEATFISKKVQLEFCDEFEYKLLRSVNNPRRPAIPGNPFRVLH
jgi:hypothetical protein